jgi:hypothetical protein
MTPLGAATGSDLTGPTPQRSDDTSEAPRAARDGPEPDAEAGELWRGPSEARWVARLLRGASPPHDRTSTPVGCVAHG